MCLYLYAGMLFYAVSIENSYSHYLNACLYTTHNFLLLCTPRSPLIEHASSMDRHTNVLMQSIMHTAMESMSSACTCGILNVLRHRSFVHTHADMRAILNMCRAMQLQHACSVKFKLSCTVERTTF